MADGEDKEKYFSLSRLRFDGNNVCGYNDTTFLCLDAGAETEPEADFVEPETSDSFRSSSLRKSSQARAERATPPVQTEDDEEGFYDNFLGSELRFHRITLYETKLRFYLVASLKDASTVGSLSSSFMFY